MADDYDYESLGANATLTQDAMAGALAGIAEHSAMYPVDSIKTRMQVIQSATATTGSNVMNTVAAAAKAQSSAFGASHHKTSAAKATVHPRHVHSSAILDGAGSSVVNELKSFKSKSRHLWRGVNSVVIGAGPAHALHYATYEACKEAFGGNTSGHHVLTNAAAGAIATLVHDSMMNPFDVVKQRMQMGGETTALYRNVRDCARQVFAKEGIVAFYISLPTTLTMSIPFQSIQFATYEFFRKVINPNGHYDPTTHAMAGGLAGAIAASVTTPLDVVKTLLQTRGTNNDPRIRNCSGLVEAGKIIKERYGYAGFFRGFKPRVLTNMPSAAISWSVYEYFKWFISRNNGHDHVASNRDILSL
ncbi:mitochondrial carrier domain-containing protein [Mycotypha africana]|uniref:mitochondrial carrier domain-containing protein n=1 Tax=Mycotypha africana TaxID=64632 RepID=UPI0023006706|nr:mitochondrial carrier domain-containing protein [Mycotypha africana]KAI8970073.1 mitochondrial carrier domain-containing protein [Mycotypha africana]